MTVTNENNKHKTLSIDPLFPPDFITKLDQFPEYFNNCYFWTFKESATVMCDMTPKYK